MTDHLSRRQLLRFVDGELSKSGMARTAEHLHACWTCRVELERLQDHITAIFDAHAEVLAPSLPPPPRPWPGLEPRLRATAEISHETRFRQCLHLLSSWAPKARLALAVTAAVFFVIVLVISLQPTRILAAEALRRSAAADSRRLMITPGQVIRQRVVVKKTRHRTSGDSAATLESWKSVKSGYWAAKESLPAELLGCYKENGLATELPLSPAAQEGWLRLAVAEPTASRNKGAVEVRAIANDAGRAQGLEAVDFRMRESDWHLDQMTLIYTDATFQVTEKDSSILDKAQLPSDVRALLEPAPPVPLTGSIAPVPPSPAPAQTAEAVNLDDVELSVRSDLHSLNADLGESIEVSVRGGQVVVDAWNVSSKRRTELAARLGNRPGVVLEFQPPDRGVETRSRTVVIPDLAPATQLQDERLQKFFGSAEAEENFTRSALEASTGVLAHFYALRALADRWPAGPDTRLSPGGKVRLLEIVADHGRKAHEVIVQMKGVLNPLLGNFGHEIRFEGAGKTELPWQESSIAGLDAARRADRILRLLLTASEARASLDDALPELQQTIRELEQIARGFRFRQDNQPPH